MDIQANIPKGLRKALAKYEHAISTVDYGGGYCTESGTAYEVCLKDGWCFDPAEHIAIEQTARDMGRRLSDIGPCQCQQCQAVNRQRADWASVLRGDGA
jgi:hypothetical protein